MFGKIETVRQLMQSLLKALKALDAHPVESVFFLAFVGTAFLSKGIYDYVTGDFVVPKGGIYLTGRAGEIASLTSATVGGLCLCLLCLVCWYKRRHGSLIGGFALAAFVAAIAGVGIAALQVAMMNN